MLGDGVRIDDTNGRFAAVDAPFCSDYVVTALVPIMPGSSSALSTFLDLALRHLFRNETETVTGLPNIWGSRERLFSARRAYPILKAMALSPWHVLTSSMGPLFGPLRRHVQKGLGLLTAFFILALLTGQWSSTSETGAAIRVFLSVLLLSLGIYLGAIWKSTPRWSAAIREGKRLLILAGGAFFLFAGIAVMALALFVVGISEPLVIVAALFLIQGAGMIRLAWRHAAPAKGSERASA